MIRSWYKKLQEVIIKRLNLTQYFIVLKMVLFNYCWAETSTCFV